MKRELAWYVLGAAMLFVLAGWVAMQRYEFIPAHEEGIVYKHDPWTENTYVLRGIGIHRVRTVEEQKQIDDRKARVKKKKDAAYAQSRKEECLERKRKVAIDLLQTEHEYKYGSEEERRMALIFLDSLRSDHASLDCGETSK